MALAAPRNESFRDVSFLLMCKSFLIWSFTLLVCYLIVGFPVFFLVVFIGSLLATSLQPILSSSAVLWVAGSFTMAHALAIFGGAAMLTLRGIHPHEVSWLSWSHPSSALNYSIAYPSCPLACSIHYEEMDA
jgi:hypothetical protein